MDKAEEQRRGDERNAGTPASFKCLENTPAYGDFLKDGNAQKQRQWQERLEMRVNPANLVQPKRTHRPDNGRDDAATDDQPDPRFREDSRRRQSSVRERSLVNSARDPHIREYRRDSQAKLGNQPAVLAERVNRDMRKVKYCHQRHGKCGKDHCCDARKHQNLPDWMPFR